jgi:hypothetical protein
VPARSLAVDAQDVLARGERKRAVEFALPGGAAQRHRRPAVGLDGDGRPSRILAQHLEPDRHQRARVRRRRRGFAAGQDGQAGQKRQSSSLRQPGNG